MEKASGGWRPVIDLSHLNEFVQLTRFNLFHQGFHALNIHDFLPVPGRRDRRYYRTSSSSFPGPYSVPPGVTSVTLEKASEARKLSVSLSASQVSSMETMLSGVCEVASWLDWWLSTCGGFREHMPAEVRADFERLILSGLRALEFLASQGCTALGYNELQ